MRRNFEVQAEEEAEAERRKDREDEERAEREEIMESRNEIGELPDKGLPCRSTRQPASLLFVLRLQPIHVGLMLHPLPLRVLCM